MTNRFSDYYTSLRQSRYFLPLVFILTFGLSFFYNLGDTPLFDRDEGAFSEATREMLERGDFVSTYLNDEPRYDKPIFIYWFQAASVSVFGVTEFGFRFPSAVFASLWALTVFFFVKKELKEDTALKSALIMATSLWVVVIGRAAIADALLNLLITLSIFSYYEFVKDSEKKFLYLVFLWSGLGFLTKGPIAVIVPVAVSFIYMVSLKRFRAWLAHVFNPLGILLFLLIAMPWYIVQYFKEGQPFIDGFILRHNVQRFTSALEGHRGSIFYYIPILLVILLPFSSLLIKTTGKIKDMFKDNLDRFLWIWFLFIFVFFSLARTKLPHYVLYGSPPLFILMAKYSDRLKSRFWALFPSILFVTIILFLPDILKLILPNVTDVYAKAMLEGGWHAFDLKYRLISGIVLVIGIIFIFLKKFTADKIVIAMGYVLTFYVLTVVAPAVGEVNQQPIKNAAAFAAENDLELVIWRLDNPSFSVYRQKVTPILKPKDGEIAITKITRLNKFAEYEILFKQGGIVIVKVIRTTD